MTETTSAKGKKREVIIHSISPIDQGYTHLLCDPDSPIGEYRVTTHPDLLVTADGKMFSPHWTLNTCLECDQRRLAARTEAIYKLVHEHLSRVGAATCTQLWDMLRYTPEARYINLSRGIMQITLRELCESGRLAFESRPVSPLAGAAMAYWYKLP